MVKKFFAILDKCFTIRLVIWIMVLLRMGVKSLYLNYEHLFLNFEALKLTLAETLQPCQ